MSDNTDDPIIIKRRQAGSSFGPFDQPWEQLTIPVSDKKEDAVDITGDSASYRWYEYVSGNQQVVVFTARKDSNGNLIEVGGGRNSYKPGDNSGFIMRGYHVFAVAGRSSDELGIPTCSGWCF